MSVIESVQNIFANYQSRRSERALRREDMTDDREVLLELWGDIAQLKNREKKADV